MKNIRITDVVIIVLTTPMQAEKLHQPDIVAVMAAAGNIKLKSF